MNKLKFIALGVAMSGLFASCIQDEQLNTEADILSCTVPAEILKAEPIIQNTSILIMVKTNANLTAIAPEFTLTPGATIEPPSKTVRNFTSPQTYKVTSQDGNWSKVYTVSFIDADLGTTYRFEDTLKREKYYIFVEKNDEGKTIMEWASGNAGFSLTGAGKTAEDFPTLQSDRGIKGKCLELVTRSTGNFGQQVGMPLAAGNLFIGKFDVLSALQSPLKATKFGLPFSNIPTYLIGYYKYKAGPEYREKNVPVAGKKDICSIQAVFYETDDQTKMLDGTDLLTNENIFSIAKLQTPVESDEWLKFQIPFITKDGKTLNTEKLKAGKYNITIVFSSSADGDKFSGAINSTLLIDEVELLYNTID